MTTWQDLKNVTDGMTQEQLSQPVYCFASFDSSWLKVNELSSLDEGDIRQIAREGLGDTIVGTPCFVVDD
jgi:hypothetical protein